MSENQIKNWSPGDIIDVDSLNNIEQRLYDNISQMNSIEQSLNDNIDSLGLLSINDLPELDGYITSEGIWRKHNTSLYKGKVIPLSIDQGTIKIVGNTAYTSYMAFLQNDQFVIGQSVSFVSNYNARITITANKVYNYEIPQGTKFIYIQTTGVDNNVSINSTPSSIIINGQNYCLPTNTAIYNYLTELNNKLMVNNLLNFNTLPEYEGYIYKSGNNDPTWETTLPSTFTLIPCISKNKRLDIITGDKNCIIAALPDYNPTQIKRFDNVVFSSESSWSNTRTINSGEKSSLTLPSDIKYLYIQRKDAQGTDHIPLHIIIDGIDYMKNNVYENLIYQQAFVAPDGDDLNGDGSLNNPYATIQYALTMGARDIILKPGIYYNTKVNLNNYYGTINISNFSKDEKVIIIDGSAAQIAQAELYQDYSRVLSSQTATGFSNTLYWLFQDGVPDENTFINNDDRHALQRGQQFRNFDTKIVKCNATTFQDALNEIENAPSNEYKWFYDTGTLYFSCPDAENLNTHKICMPTSSTFFISNHPGVTVNCTGIEFKYMGLNLNQTVNSTITDCKVTNANTNGGFTYDYGKNITFKRCEVANTIRTSLSSNTLTGDGFNGHSSNKTGDLTGKHTTATFIDCWSHDNYDDGHSDHELCETTIIGGLYEWNGKAGITPAYGAHCTVYNTISKNNYNGFLVAGEADDEGVGTQGIFINCISKNNIYGTDDNAGFIVRGNLNSMFCYNCSSIDNKIGYYAYNNGKIFLSNCTNDGYKSTVNSNGTVSINKSSYVTPSYEIHDISNFNRYQGNFRNNTIWNNINDDFQHIAIPVKPNMRLEIHGNSENAFYYACVKDYEIPSSTSTVNLSAYSPFNSYLSGGKDSVRINILPPDAKYVLIATQIKQSNEIKNTTPAQVDITDIETVPIKWCALGDSITQGHYSAIENDTVADHTDTVYTWAPTVARINNWSLDNKAIGGTGFIDPVNNPEDHDGQLLRAWEVARDTDFTQYDIVTVAYGINDYKGNQPLGKLDTAYDNVDTPNSVYTSIQSIITSILGPQLDTNSTSKPSIKLIFITPLNMYKQDNTYYGSYGTNYALGQLNNAKDADDSSINAPYTLEDLFNAIVECCEYYGVEYIDMTHRSIINRQNIRHLLPDGVHPSLEAHKVLAHELSKKINF